ncbi:MAG: 6,7-dimethyl-8-ribityllumazine synthase [Armatimonadota bacterium]|nr:6,7-dimethyl-8-ribityllumazine synthase [Armatimonadota bacterium]MDR7533283.1 6,7-dimethyl-8-ribityllumazine synthase [Armatimonadota bacterium]MDR7536924.1 6,7-dimethyl-8-ribityllumazine synthase [Armatimonadota bacterium]
MGQVYDGSDDATGLRFAVAVSRYNEAITARLLASCRRVLEARGAAAVDVAWVPGALELPLVARRLAATGRYHAVIALGCVIRGETLHFELVAREAAAGLSRVALETGVPVINEVLAVYAPAQAHERAGGRLDRGVEAAQAAVHMATLMRQLAAAKPGPAEHGCQP